MTQDEIIEMARQADASFETAESMFKFAKLVAAKEHAACLEIANYCADADMHASFAANAIRARSISRGEA